MAVNFEGLIMIIIFYSLIFVVGIWAAWRRRKKESNTEEAMLASRSIGSILGLFTLTATWVGGSYVNGCAEVLFSSGLVWCQAPFGYAISLILGGLFFARKMRDAGYVTMLDPLQELFGSRWGAFLLFPAVAGDVFSTAATLAALGTTLTVILNLNRAVSIFISAAISVSYTLFGGLTAVAYTDVVQLFCIFTGLWLSVPFAITHEAVGSLSLNQTEWIGAIEKGSYEWGEWTDYFCLLIFGGIPWQVYFQRVLSARTSRQARNFSIASSFGCIIMVIPSCIIGVIAKATDWEATSFNRSITSDDDPMILPLVIRHLTPTWVAYVGLGAASAAAMSSTDSCVLSSASMIAKNLYKNVLRLKASEREVMIVMRITVVVVSILASLIAIYENSIYALVRVCGDLVYVMLFPQLTLAVHASDYVNIYGSIAAFFIGLIVRILGGEKTFKIPALIKFPWYDENQKRQLFPFRTLAMLVTLICLLFFSWLTKKLKVDANCFRKSKGSLTQSRKRGIDNPTLREDFNNEKPLPYDSVIALSFDKKHLS